MNYNTNKKKKILNYINFLFFFLSFLFIKMLYLNFKIYKKNIPKGEKFLNYYQLNY